MPTQDSPTPDEQFVVISVAKLNGIRSVMLRLFEERTLNGDLQRSLAKNLLHCTEDALPLSDDMIERMIGASPLNCPNCESKNTAALGTQDQECHDCGVCFSALASTKKES